MTDNVKKYAVIYQPNKKTKPRIIAVFWNFTDASMFAALKAGLKTIPVDLYTRQWSTIYDDVVFEINDTVKINKEILL